MTKTDPFLKAIQTKRSSPVPAMGDHHSSRAHSKFSASGAERWFNCSGSVWLSEGLPDKSSIWAKEGTKAHEVLEDLLVKAISAGDERVLPISRPPGISFEMQNYAVNAANLILGIRDKHENSEIQVETRIYLDFIHKEMFGTFDAAVIEHFGILNVFDFKYGISPVSPGTKDAPNLQMVFYGLGLAHLHHWDFKRVRLWIIQPRVSSYEGPLLLELKIEELRSFVLKFEEAVRRVERFPGKYVEGAWCHFCKAKSICPLKREVKLKQATNLFSGVPVKGTGRKDFY